MSDDQERQQDQAVIPQQPQIVIADTQTQLRLEQQAIAQIGEDAKALRMDETEPGGRYFVNGQFVDANGQRHPNQRKGK